MSTEVLPHPAQDEDKPDLITGIPDYILNPVSGAESVDNLGEDNLDPDGLWGYTQAIVKKSGETYQGRRLIGRDSPVDGGVYFGTYGGEAIVVDSEKYPEQYDILFKSVIEKSTVDGKVQKSKVLQAVFDTVKDGMQYSQEGVDRITRDLPDGDKIELSSFMQEGVGVCRHQALAVAVMLEKMKKEGHISGDISVDRNMQWSPKGEKEGHAWVRYTGSNGVVGILDVAQNNGLVLLQDVDPAAGWNYLRPEEQREFIERSAQLESMAVQESATDVRRRGLEAQLKEIKDRFSEEDGLRLSSYASNRLNKSDAQARGDGNASIYHEQASGQAYRGLSREAQEQASNYYRIRVALDKLEN